MAFGYCRSLFIYQNGGALEVKKIAVVFLVLAAFISGAGCSGVTSPRFMASQVGTELKQEQRFTLMNLKNEPVNLDSVLSKNKVVLINFWATWCAYCVEEMPDLVKLQDKYQSRGFTVLAVNVGESSEQASQFAKKMGLNFPIVLDEDNSVAQKYGIVGIPVSYLIGSDGKILGEYHGFTPTLVSDVEKNLN